MKAFYLTIMAAGALTLGMSGCEDQLDSTDYTNSNTAWASRPR